MPASWRLLVEPRPAHGAWNMAVDEELLAAAAGGHATLRLYRWRGPWLSLGYAQALSAARQAACRAAGVGVVRRVTGGRAVLHGCDLTYAVAAPAARLPEGLDASYRLLSEVLLAALRALGVEASAAPTPPGPVPREAAFDCFAEPAADEICVGGAKLVGSAQRRLGGAFLQHGSIRLAPDPAEAAAAAGLGAGATSLAELGVPEAVQSRLWECLPEALGAALGVDLVCSGLDRAGRRSALARASALRREPLARRAVATVLASRAP